MKKAVKSCIVYKIKGSGPLKVRLKIILKILLLQNVSKYKVGI